ncbi:NAD(P)-dependent oxidoreductase [Cytobacillus sp. S13-E01]|uniref:NAD-dependent epimerase/dehydratase family protein n=1 Tax=Cytobacillus sp. S13-E01 TaxID=3031326 RepID=UPI0023D82200|nr:NAD(P)-dependent oxidoreductase [Cytobacillus sp. S13-E01]MDF0728601.1 NAD(P)-dependent oxidoreductase [Cytobacillus sp. S13-E01]
MCNKIVVGGLGFLGFSLCCHFIEEEVNILAFDDMADDEEVKEEKLLRIGRNAFFQYRDIQDFRSLMKEENCDTVFYSLFDSAKDRYSPDIDACIGKTRQLLNDVISFCRMNGSKLILVSTYDVFGNEQFVVDEDTKPVPDSDNGKLHVEEEKLVRETLAEESIQYAIVRMPTLFGPGQPSHLIYQQAIMANLKKQSRDYFVTENTRDIFYIEDAVHALVRLEEKTLPRKIIHLTSGEENRWYEGAYYIKNDLRLEERGEPRTIISKSSKKLLDIKPNTSIKEGVEKQIEYAKQLKERHK